MWQHDNTLIGVEAGQDISTGSNLMCLGQMQSVLV